MYKNVLQGIDHIAIWPVISFVIFFAFFLGLLLWVFMVDKKFINRMKSLPLDGEIKNQQHQLLLTMCSPKSEAHVPVAEAGQEPKKKCSGKCKDCREKKKRETR